MSYGRFGTNTGPIFIVPIGCPETSVRNYHYSLRKNPEQHSFPMPIDCIYISTANDPKKKKATSTVVLECRSLVD